MEGEVRATIFSMSCSGTVFSSVCGVSGRFDTASTTTAASSDLNAPFLEGGLRPRFALFLGARTGLERVAAIGVSAFVTSLPRSRSLTSAADDATPKGAAPITAVIPIARLFTDFLPGLFWSSSSEVWRGLFSRSGSISDTRENCPARAATELIPMPSMDGRSGARAATEGRVTFFPIALVVLSFLFFSAAVRSLTSKTSCAEGCCIMIFVQRPQRRCWDWG
mmetsp:Transcript_11398/g.23850  ORF Transcript_11398/g.23850 Transcript_11398/m.23850 type:complete len:222 (-) Transcript_11398:178-843(-)